MVQFKIKMNNNKLQPVVNCPLSLVRKGGKISSEIVYFLLPFIMTIVANALSVVQVLLYLYYYVLYTFVLSIIFYLLLFSLPAGKEQREQSVVKYQNISFIQNQSQAQTSNMSSFFPIYKRLLFQT